MFVARSVRDVMIKIGANVRNRNSCVLILIMKKCVACANLLDILQEQDSSYMKKYPLKQQQPHIFVIDIDLLFDYLDDASVPLEGQEIVEDLIKIGTGVERGVRVPCTFRVIPNKTRTAPVFSSNPIHGILSNSFISSLFK